MGEKRFDKERLKKEILDIFLIVLGCAFLALG